MNIDLVSFSVLWAAYFSLDIYNAYRIYQDQSQELDALLGKTIASPTRRALLASLTMYSSFNPSRYLSGPHGSTYKTYMIRTCVCVCFIYPLKEYLLHFEKWMS